MRNIFKFFHLESRKWKFGRLVYIFSSTWLVNVDRVYILCQLKEFEIKSELPT